MASRYRAALAPKKMAGTSPAIWSSERVCGDQAAAALGVTSAV